MQEKSTNSSRFEGTRWLEVLELQKDATVAGFVSKEIKAKVEELTSLRLSRVQMTQLGESRSKGLKEMVWSPCYRAVRFFVVQVDCRAATNKRWRTGHFDEEDRR